MSVWRIHGSAMRNTAATPISLGTNASVCSWICVTAWSTLTMRPSTSATMSIGAATISAIMMALRARSTTSCGPMRLPEARDEALHDQRPAVHEDEQEQLERQRDHRRWEHEHAHAHQHRRHDDVDDDEGQEEREAD